LLHSSTAEQEAVNFKVPGSNPGGAAKDDGMRNKVIAITGGTGLIGTHLKEELHRQGAIVHVMDHDEYDVASIADVKSFILATQPDYIVHLASYTDTKLAKKYPSHTFDTNVIGAMNILNAAKEYGKASRIILASSDRSQVEPHSPYGASKLAMESIAMSYQQTYFMPISILRFCNVYGTGDRNFSRFIPAVMKAYIYNETFTITNGGLDYRGYIHVNDVVNAICLAAGSDVSGIFNICSHQTMSNYDVFNRINNKLDNKINYEILGTPGKMYYGLSTSGSRMILGWDQAHSFDDSIDEVIDWYKNLYGVA